MLEYSNEVRGGLLKRILAHREGTSLAALSSATGYSKASLSHHLRRLIEEGLVERVGRGPSVRFRGISAFRASWTVVHRSADIDSPFDLESFETTWSSSGPLDMRFPFLTRIPDEAGRATMQRFLDAAWREGLLTPWLLLRAELAEKKIEIDSSLDEDEVVGRAIDPDSHEGLSVFVYGSRARGDARPQSDLDVLIAYQSDALRKVPFGYEERFRELVSRMNLGAARQIDLVLKPRDDLWDWWNASPPEIRRGLAQDGITVYSTSGEELIEFLRTGHEESDRAG